MSVVEFNGHSFSAEAGEALTRYRFAKHTGTLVTQAKVGEAEAAQRTAGINAETYASGKMAAVFTDGMGFLEVNGNSVAIVAGDPLKSNATGLGVKAASAGNIYGAVAVDPSTADGDIIRVIIERGVLHA